MLTDADLLLITAAVDGELSPADARRFDALVASDPLAATVAGHLRQNARRLRRLPPRPAPAGLVTAVLARLPQVVARTRRRSGRPIWLPYAVAASLLFTVTAASFWFFSARPQDRETAAKTRPIPQNPQVLPATSLPEAVRPELVVPQPPVAVLPDELPLPREVAVGPRPRDLAPMPRSHGGDFVGAGISERSKPLQTVDLKLPYIGTVGEFARDEVRTRFAEDFAGDPAIRIDLFARNMPAAIEMLTAAAKNSGVTVTVDAVAQDWIGKKAPAAYALLVEGLTPAELATFLEGVSKLATASPQPAITNVHAFAAGSQEQKDWKELFGRDLGFFRSARVDPPSPTRPITEGTIGKIKTTVGKNPEKAGLLLTYLPLHARSAPTVSKEIKGFLDGRGDRKAGTLPAFVVLRPAAN